MLGLAASCSLFLLASTSAAAAQAQALTPPTALSIAGDVSKPISFNASDLKAMPRQKAELKAEDGTPHVYEGVLVGELLKRAGAPVGADLRGNAIASYVVASATDGYQVVFSLAELDPAFSTNEIMVADTIDGKPIPAGQGPWRIVAPKDAHPSRSVRMLQRLEVVRLRK
jgi:DMSO/TMAO reductase YedYZ molybdopterin-dependent catalytic subunit